MQQLETEIVTILAETGIHFADGSTPVASLSLAWILHQLEQRHGVVIELNDTQLAHAVDVDSLVQVLEPVLFGETS